MEQAVIFDMGGVLAHEAWGRARLAEFDAMLGQERGSLVQLLFSGPAWEAYSTGELSPESYWAQTGAPLEKYLPHDFRHFQDNFWGAELDLATVLLARRLRSRYRIALLSNASPFLPKGLLQEPHLHDLFDRVIISAYVGMRKPDPDIFHYACRLLALPPSACILVDDKIRNTMAAESLGMKAVVHTNALETERALRALGIALTTWPDAPRPNPTTRRWR